MNPNQVNASKSDYKIIHDTVHGTIKLEEPLLGLLETPEIQRLNSIHQLGLAYLVFPGANHTRLEHSLGTYHVADCIAKALNLNNQDRELVITAALLHDVGHGPYSHTPEFLFNSRLNLSHTELTRDIIRGRAELFKGDKFKVLGSNKKIVEILDAHDIDSKINM
jgi:putative nucleotidyltransferase with HDIG domain